MENKLLSIIVPIYNKGAYLRQCMESFLMDCDDLIEVILVDDGSTDDSRQIIEEYTRMHPNLFVPIYKENGGVGSALNSGIRIAKGIYLKEVDADDWVDNSALYKLVCYLKNTNVDLIINPYRVVNDICLENNEVFDKNIIWEKEYEVTNIISRASISIQRITFKKKLLEKQQYKLLEERYYIDMEIVPTVLLNAHNCVFLKNSLYRYRVGLDDQSVNMQNYLKHIDAFFNETILNIKKYENIKDEKAAKEKCVYMRNTCYQYSILLYAFYCLKSGANISRLEEEILRRSSEIYDMLEDIPFIKELREYPDISQEGCKKEFRLKYFEEVKRRGGREERNIINDIFLYKDKGEIPAMRRKYELLNQWLINKQLGKSIDEYLINNGIKKIAIYGLGDIGQRLIAELSDSKVTVKYAVDQVKTLKDIQIEKRLLVKKPEEIEADVDTIVITVFNGCDEIKEMISNKFGIKTVHIEDLIYCS